MITGQDLVEWQLRVASGEILPLQQQDIHIRGHAIEVRVYAEDPAQDFLPQTGKLHYLREPMANRYVRIDTGVRELDDISPFYDPMIAKLIVWDENRQQAISRMLNALQGYHIAGVTTNLNFLSQLVGHAAFAAAELDTNFIPRHQPELFAKHHQSTEQAAVLAALYLLKQTQSQISLTRPGPWQDSSGWQLNTAPQIHFTLSQAEQSYRLQITRQTNSLLVQLQEKVWNCQVWLDGDHLTAILDGHRCQAYIGHYQQHLTIFSGQERTDFIYQPQADIAEHTDHGGNLKAPMNGTVVDVRVKAGSKVAAGETLLVMEAMKMEYSIKAPTAGTVNQLFYASGDLVQDGAELVDFTPEEA